MLEFLFPDEYVKSIYEIDYDNLIQKHKNRLIFDIDNTITPFDVELPDQKIITFFDYLKKMGFKACLVSNNNKQRVEKFNQKLNLPYVFKARKPSLGGLKKAMVYIKGNKKNTVFIGDQVFTDIWCGNRMDLYTILVEPVANRDEFSVRLKRGLEKKVIGIYVKRKR